MGAPSIEDYENAHPARRHGVDITYNTVGEKWNFSSGLSFQRNDLAGRREGDVYTIMDEKYTRFPSDGERSFNEINYSGRLTADYQPSDKYLFSLGLYVGKRTKERTADIIYYNNYAITDKIDYQFQYYNENLRIRKSDFVLGVWITIIVLKIQLSSTLPFFMNTLFWEDPLQIETWVTPTIQLSIKMNIIPTTILSSACGSI